jgi:serine/threonine protein kinase
MATNTKSLSVLFDEGDGYRLVRRLGLGCTAQVMAVKNQKDGKIYARKRLLYPASTPFKDNVPNEVWITRKLGPHQLIPFIADVFESPPGQWSIIFQFCNGGDLDQLIVSHSKLAKPIPEASMWHIYSNVASAVAFLHHGWREGQPLPSDWDTIFHGDLHVGNVYLDYPPGSDIPNVMLGDFGYSTYRKGYDFNEPLFVNRERHHWSFDILQFGTILRDLMVAANQSEGPENHIFVNDEGFDEYLPWQEYVPQGAYSKDLWAWICKLEKKYPYHGLPTALELAETLVPLAKEQISKPPPASLKWTWPMHVDKPALSPDYVPQIHDDGSFDSQPDPPPSPGTGHQSIPTASPTGLLTMNSTNASSAGSVESYEIADEPDW